MYVVGKRCVLLSGLIVLQLRVKSSRLCSAVEEARRSLEKTRTPKNTLFTAQELDWFSRDTYNTAIRSLAKWTPSISLRIASVCIRFLDLYRNSGGIDGSTLAELSYRRMLCVYLCAFVSVDLARLQDSTELLQLHYLAARRHIEDFRKNQDLVRAKLPGTEAEDLGSKFPALLGLDFEAAARTKDWEALRGIVEEAVSLGGGDIISTFEYMADSLICSEAPSRIRLIVMQAILDHTALEPMTNVAKLSGWVRTLVQLSVTKVSKVTETLLAEIVEIVKKRNETQSYPEGEIQWLAGIVTPAVLTCA